MPTKPLPFLHSSPSWQQPSGLLGFLAIGLLGIQLLINLPLCWFWQKTDDVAFLYYLSWLANEHHYVAYRDLFDTSFPGTFVFYQLLTTLTGYSDLAFHLVDMALSGLLLFLTWSLLRPIGHRPAFAAAIGFGLFYATRLHSVHLQRDFLVLLPLVASVLLARTSSISLLKRAFVIGVLFGFISSIKPQLAIGWPVVLGLAILLSQQPTNSAPKYIPLLLVSAMGGVSWWLFIAIWLAWQGGLGAFVDMVRNYLPLYAALDENLHPVSWQEHWRPFAATIFQQQQRNMLFACLATAWLCFSHHNREARALACSLLALLACYVLAIFIGGKNWDYHRIPAMYFVYVTAALLLATPALAMRTSTVLSAACALLFILFSFGSFSGFFHQLSNLPATMQTRWERTQREYHTYAQAGANENNWSAQIPFASVVEPRITSTEGSYFRIALEQHWLPASRFPLALMFYQYIDEPVVQHARQELIAALHQHPPAFIVDNQRTALIQDTAGTHATFPEYEHFLANRCRSGSIGIK